MLDEVAELYHEDTIFIRLHAPDEFFNPSDPAPEPERELSDAVEAYIFKELEHKKTRARIGVTFIADDVSLYDIAVMRNAFAHHFKTRAEEQIIKNRKSVTRWLVKLFLGVSVLAVFLFLAHLFRMHANGHPVFSILSEGFGIVGWVALWEPATYFLYGRNDEHRRLLHYMRLHRAVVTIQNAHKA